MLTAGPDFRPLPLLGNAHVQTLLGSLLPAPRMRPRPRERLVQLPDGDWLILYDSAPAGWRTGDRIALLVHGLSGSHASGYMVRVARALHRQGLRVVRMDLRGAGRGVALARRPYHGGCSDDVRAAADSVLSESPNSALSLVGFSLGGSIVLKLAGEAADMPLLRLERVAALAPPVDFERCVALLGRPANRIYDYHFARDLVRQVRLRRRLLPDEPPTRFPRRMTLRLFDELYTAPRWGFRDAADYYARASSLQYVPRIRVPAFILAARDDPFVDADPLRALTDNPNVHVEIADRGGHLGFLGFCGNGRGLRWAEARLADWVARPTTAGSPSRSRP